MVITVVIVTKAVTVIMVMIMIMNQSLNVPKDFVHYCLFMYNNWKKCFSYKNWCFSIQPYALL
jgi:hypothetical protein